MDKVPHKVTVCQVPGCGGKLGSDKEPYNDSANGVRIRSRVCKKCGLANYTKQGPEEFTGLEENSR